MIAHRTQFLLTLAKIVVEMLEFLRQPRLFLLEFVEFGFLLAHFLRDQVHLLGFRFHLSDDVLVIALNVRPTLMKNLFLVFHLVELLTVRRLGVRAAFQLRLQFIQRIDGRHR